MKFEDLLSNDELLDALYDMHFDECTPIQESAIPLILEGRDLLACAQTGTGKTAAYLLPVIERIVDDGYPDDCVNCVVMSPTRELAQQIDQQMQGFSYFVPVTSLPIYGGTDGLTYEVQRKGLKNGADVVIATPGRLLSHLSMGYVDLSKVSFFILDEADRMLDMGFLDDIMQIFGRLPKDCQILLFSATMPPKIQTLANNILKNPAEIKLAVSKPAEKIEQLAYVCYEPQKIDLLTHLFSETDYKRVIIFSSSKLKVKQLSSALRKLKLNVAEMHSDLDQKQREDVMLDFKAGKTNFIVATDILSRGIDIDDIELVVNFDVPREPEDYVHRVGRTARADRHGRAITFISADDQFRFLNIEKLLEREVTKGIVPESLGDVPPYNPSGQRKNRYRGSCRKNRGRKKTNTKPADKNNNNPANSASQPKGDGKTKKRRRNHRKRNTNKETNKD